MATAVAEKPLQRLQALGQSVWLDFIGRRLIRSDELRRLIEVDGVSGVTSNPSIFEKALSASSEYDEDIGRLAAKGYSAAEVYEALTVQDIRDAADVLRPVYDHTQGCDGFVSLEVSPHLSHDTQGTIEEARRLWGELRRPNVMIKIPATTDGLPAIRQCIGEGMNVNITLLFGLPRYRRVAEAYIKGLEMLVGDGKRPGRTRSVASFFLSRIDAKVDPMLQMIADAGAGGSELARFILGNVAVSLAKVAYQMYRDIFSSERFDRLRQLGAVPQRLLWASTSTKNPSYSDVKYIDAIIGPETVDTIPYETLEAYRDHGRPGAHLAEGVEEANHMLAQLPDLGIRLRDVSRQLEEEGIEKFIQPYDATLAALKAKAGR